jgi:small subunit ribosomal protein S9
MRKAKENRLAKLSENLSSSIALQNALAQANASSVLNTNAGKTDGKDVVYCGFGKRKRAKAYVKLTPGEGKITVNGIPSHRYFNTPFLRAKLTLPLRVTGLSSCFDIKVITFGGGYTGQLDACIPAVARAIVSMDEKYKKVLAQSKFNNLILDLMLVHDPRNVEPKKPGRIKARKGYVYNRR